MGNRHEINRPTPATVVDLDGTFLTVNSLHLYIQCSCMRLLQRGRIGTLLHVASIIMRRKCRRLTHAEMKRKLLDIMSGDDGLNRHFAEKAKGRLNKSVNDIIAHNRDLGHRILLATAAPGFYTQLIWDGDFVATDYVMGCEMSECRGEQKLHKVRKWLAENNCCLHTVISDHLDDAPLFAEAKCGDNILVSPDRRTLRFFRELEPTEFLLVE